MAARYVARVTAPPAEGRANDALCRLIAKRVGVGRTRVSVIRGARSRRKVIRAGVRRALGLAARPSLRG